MAYLAKDGHWYTDFTFAGVRYRERTELRGQSIKVQGAVKRLQADRKAMVKAEASKAESKRKRNHQGKIVDQTVAEAFDEYYHEVGRYAATAHDIRVDLVRMLGYMGKQMMLSDIDTETVIDMRECRRQDLVPFKTKDGKPPIDKATGAPKIAQPISARTVNYTVAKRLSFVLNYMQSKGRNVQAIQWKRVMLKETPRKTKFTYEHERLLLTTYRKDHLPALTFALLSGARLAQFSDLRWGDIDWDAETITFKPLKQMVFNGNNYEPYVIPMTASIRTLILSQIDPETGKPYDPEYVWTKVNNRTFDNPKSKKRFVKGERSRLMYEGISTEWTRWKAKHDLQNVRLHDLRHAFGERLAAACGDPMIVRDSMNHSDISTTERYMGAASVARIRAAMEARDALDRQREVLTLERAATERSS